jgi:hypothetical protein
VVLRKSSKKTARMFNLQSRLTVPMQPAAVPLHRSEFYIICLRASIYRYAN